MPQGIIGAFVPDKDFKTLSADPDSCLFAGRPHSKFDMKLRKGELVVISSGGMDQTPAHPHFNKAFKTVFSMPGKALWSDPMKTGDSRQVTFSRGDVQFTFSFRVVGYDRLKLSGTVGARPPADSFEFQFAKDVGTGVRVNAAGDLEFTAPHHLDGFDVPYLTLSAWKATDASGGSLGMKWRVQTGRIYLDLTKVDWDSAVYPATIDPTIIDNDGNVTGSQNKGLQDATGQFWAIWYESNNRVWVNRTVGGIWQTKVLLAGPVGSGAYTEFTNPADVAACWNPTRTRLHVILYSTLTETRYTTLTNLANWNQSTAWLQNGESLQGSSSVSGRAPGYPCCEVDSVGNLYVSIHDGDVNQDYVLKRLVTSPFTWTEALTFAANSRGTGLCVTTDDRIHVVTTYNIAAVNYRRSTNPSDITAWGADTKVLDGGGGGFVAYDCAIMEEGDNKLIVFAVIIGFGAYWNYWNGSSWTQGTTGSTVGFGDSNGNAAAINQRQSLCRDGAKNVYVGYWANTTADYYIKEFTGTTWALIATGTKNVGAGDSVRDIALEPRVPSDKSTAGCLYIDLAGGATDELWFDTFAVTAAAAASAPAVHSPSLLRALGVFA